MVLNWYISAVHCMTIRWTVCRCTVAGCQHPPLWNCENVLPAKATVGKFVCMCASMCLSSHVCVCACAYVHSVLACMCVYIQVWCARNTMTIQFIIFEVLMYTLLLIMSSTVSEIWCCRNYRDYYYHEIQHGVCKSDSSLNVLPHMYNRLVPTKLTLEVCKRDSSIKLILACTSDSTLIFVFHLAWKKRRNLIACSSVVPFCSLSLSTFSVVNGCEHFSHCALPRQNWFSSGQLTEPPHSGVVFTKFRCEHLLSYSHLSKSALLTLSPGQSPEWSPL